MNTSRNLTRPVQNERALQPRNTLRASHVFRGRVDRAEDGDWIGRWRRESVDSTTLSRAIKRLLAELTDHELAVYLAQKCCAGGIRQPTRRGLF